MDTAAESAILVTSHPYRQFEKVLAECALVVLAVSRAPIPPALRCALDDVAGRLIPLVRRRHYEIVMKRLPYTALSSAGAAHVMLSCAGYEDARFDAVLRDALDQSQETERPPARMLERRWIRYLFDPEFGLTVADVLPLTLLARVPHPIYLTRTDAYAVAHTLWYVTDLGLREPPYTIDRGRLTKMVECAVAWLSVTDDWDLLGEFLACAALTEAQLSRSFLFAWEVFLHALRATLIGMEASADHRWLRGRGTWHMVGQRFQRTYHLVLVGGLLSALLLRHRWRVQDEAVEQAAGVPSVLAFLRQHGSCAWANAMLHRGVSRREEEIIVDGLLTMAARAYDLATLRTLLGQAGSAGLRYSVTMAECEHFLVLQRE